MKRRAFIGAAVAAVVVVAVPAVFTSCRRKGRKAPLNMPYVLEKFCDENEIREIGKRYRLQMPMENAKEKLSELLLANKEGKSDRNLSNSAIDKLLEKKIKEEFSAYKTIIVNGWIISQTEARQCALFSLTQN
jgi:hypothetical protein